jgi:hypothetical protein
VLPKLSRRSSCEGSGERKTDVPVLLRRLWVPVSTPSSSQVRRASCTACTASSSVPERALSPAIHCSFSAKELATR